MASGGDVSLHLMGDGVQLRSELYSPHSNYGLISGEHGSKVTHMIGHLLDLLLQKLPCGLAVKAVIGNRGYQGRVGVCNGMV